MGKKITLTFILLAFVFMWYLSNYNFITGLAVEDIFEELEKDDLGDFELNGEVVVEDQNTENQQEEQTGDKTLAEKSTVQPTQQIPSYVIVHESGGFCGDSIRQLGEDCSNCPADIKCSKNAYCDIGVCIPKKSSFNLLLIILIAVFSLGIIFSGFIIVKKKFEKKPAKEQKVIAEEPRKEQRKEIVTNYDELEKYIENALKSGYEKTEVRNLLIQSGWKQDDVDFVLRKFNQKQF